MKEKKVTNLLMQISKIRDLLDEGNVEKIFSQKFLIDKTRNEIKRQVHKYIMHEAHELDFNSEDIKALAEGFTKIDKKLPIMMYNDFYKKVMDIIPIDDNKFHILCSKYSTRFYYDKYIKEITNDLHFYAVVTWLWSESDYKKDFMEQITDCFKTFL